MPKYASDVDRVRWYRNPNRHDNRLVYRSVTSVTGALPKPQLLAWYANTVAEYACSRHDEWINMPQMDAYDWLRGAPYRTRDRAATKGSNVHAVIENILRGEKYEVLREVDPWINSAKDFIQETQPRAEWLEGSVYDERTMTAGTFDFLGRLTNYPELGRCLIDWKTSKGVYPDMAVQLVGGYLFGAEYILDNDGNETQWREPDSALIVHLGPEGYEVRLIPKDRTLRRAFLGCLEIRKWEDSGAGKLPDPLKMVRELPVFDDKPTPSELANLKARLAPLPTDAKLAIQTIAQEEHIATDMRVMKRDDVERVLGLIAIYETGEPVIERAENLATKRVSRPMP